MANRLIGAKGEASLHEWIPGIGFAYNPNDNLTVFAGVHRGFAPPRTEDLISNAGGAVDVDSEKSTNYELVQWQVMLRYRKAKPRFQVWSSADSMTLTMVCSVD